MLSNFAKDETYYEIKELEAEVKPIVAELFNKIEEEDQNFD